MIRFNNVLESFYLFGNRFGSEWDEGFLDAVRHNRSLGTCMIRGCESEVQKELNCLTRWNWRVRRSRPLLGNINSEHSTVSDNILSYYNDRILSYQDFVVNILLVLNEVDICSDLVWNVVQMLSVRDFELERE